MDRPFVETMPATDTRNTSVYPDSSLLPTTRTITLSRGNVHAIYRKSQVIHIVFGNAWITFDGQDFILHGGDEIVLTPGADKAVISALGDQSLVYQIYPVDP